MIFLFLYFYLYSGLRSLSDRLAVFTHSSGNIFICVPVLLFKVNLNNIKRCVLVNYDPATEEIEFRH